MGVADDDGKPFLGLFKGFRMVGGFEASCLLGFGVSWPLAIAPLVGTGYTRYTSKEISFLIVRSVTCLMCVDFVA